MANPKVGDVGTVFTLTIQDAAGVAIDISGASTKDVVVMKSDGTKVTRTGTFTGDGTDGKLDWTSLVGDLDTAGILQMEAYVKLPSGEWRTTIATVDVRPAL